MTDDSRSPLPDDEPDELDLLASRVLDGDTDPVERARAEADPAVAARLAAMAHTRAELRDLPALDPTVTAHAVAAALAVFDEQHSSLTAAAGLDTPTHVGTDTPIAPVVPLRRRTGWSSAVPWLGAAAAAAALVVGVASMAGRGGDDLAVSPAADTQVEARDQAAPEVASAPESGDVTVMTADDGTGGAPAEGDAPIDSTGRVGDDAPAETAVPMSGNEAPAATQAPVDPELSVAGDTTVLEDTTALEAWADTSTPVEGASICAPDAELLTTDALFGDDPATAVVVEVVRDGAGDIVAYDIATCSETARVPRG